MKLLQENKSIRGVSFSQRNRPDKSRKKWLVVVVNGEETVLIWAVSPISFNVHSVSNPTFFLGSSVFDSSDSPS